MSQQWPQHHEMQFRISSAHMKKKPPFKANVFSTCCTIKCMPMFVLFVDSQSPTTWEWLNNGEESDHTLYTVPLTQLHSIAVNILKQRKKLPAFLVWILLPFDSNFTEMFLMVQLRYANIVSDSGLATNSQQVIIPSKDDLVCLCMNATLEDLIHKIYVYREIKTRNFGPYDDKMYFGATRW